MAAKERELAERAKKGDIEAEILLGIIDNDKELRWRCKYNDPDAKRKLKEFEEIQDLRQRATKGDPVAIARLKKMEDDLKKKASKDKNAKAQLDNVRQQIESQ